MRTGSGLLRRLRLAWAKSTLHDLEWFCGTWVLVPVFAAVLLGGAVVEFASLHRYGFLYELARADGRSTFADPLSEAEAFLRREKWMGDFYQQAAAAVIARGGKHYHNSTESDGFTADKFCGAVFSRLVPLVSPAHGGTTSGAGDPKSDSEQLFLSVCANAWFWAWTAWQAICTWAQLQLDAVVFMCLQISELFQLSVPRVVGSLLLLGCLKPVQWLYSFTAVEHLVAPVSGQQGASVWWRLGWQVPLWLVAYVVFFRCARGLITVVGMFCPEEVGFNPWSSECRLFQLGVDTVDGAKFVAQSFPGKEQEWLVMLGLTRLSWLPGLWFLSHWLRLFLHVLLVHAL
eukprot:g18619.t1